MNRSFTHTLGRRAAVLAAAALLAGAPLHQAAAQEFPARDIHIICGYDAGTGADVIVRYFASKLEAAAGKPVIVENKGGALTTIAAKYVAQAKPDGYTMFITAGNSTMSANSYIFKSLSYDPVKDFTPVTTLLQLPFLLVTSPKTPVKTVTELTAYLKAKGDKVNYGQANAFGVAAAELYKTISGFGGVSVAYRSTPLAITDMNGGQIDFIFSDATFGVEQAKAGTINALAVTSSKRLSAAPEIPTMAEAGVTGFELIAWWGAWLPAGAPQPVVDKLAGWLNQIVATDESKEFMRRNGAEPFPGNAKSQMDYQVADTAKWVSVLRAAKFEQQ
jgi:tripartite-type tricarboxylate transporter receptor subunit TctC